MSKQNQNKKLQFSKVWQKVLKPEEKIKHEFTIGKRYRCFWMIIGVLIGIVLAIKVYWLGISIIAVSFIYFSWYIKKANAYAFTNKRILSHQGYPSTEMISIDYDKITDVLVEEPILDKLFTKTGHLLINTAGGPKKEIKFKHIQEPYLLKKELESARESKQS